MVTRVPWTFQEVDHWTITDLIETMSALSEQDEIDEFQAAYADVCGSDEIAEQNIGYMLHVIRSTSKKEANRLSELFGVDEQSERIHHTFGATSLGLGPHHPKHPENVDQESEAA